MHRTNASRITKKLARMVVGNAFKRNTRTDGSGHGKKVRALALLVSLSKGPRALDAGIGFLTVLDGLKLSPPALFEMSGFQALVGMKGRVGHLSVKLQVALEVFDVRRWCELALVNTKRHMSPEMGVQEKKRLVRYDGEGGEAY